MARRKADRYRYKHVKKARIRVRCGNATEYRWLEFRCSAEESMCYVRAAGGRGQLSEWVRAELARAASVGASDANAPKLIDAIDGLAMEAGLERSAWIRQALLRALQRGQQAPGDARRVQQLCVPRDG